MAGKYVITCNNTADLPQEFIEKNGLPIAHLGYSIDGEDYDGDQKKLDPKDFYALMREGKMTKTHQVSPEGARAVIEPFLQQGYDVLHIAFSSGLSGTCGSTEVAAQELREQYPERKIEVVDSLCASLGEGLLVYRALKLKSEGKTLDEVRDWLYENRLHLCHYFTVDDLNFLYRGGRVSKTAAFFGTMLGIKPVLHVDDEGHLIPLTKVRGRRQSLQKLVDYMEELAAGRQNDIVFISHGDCQEDAQYVADEVGRRLGIENFIINYVGPTIGAHSGPGTVALFFFGEKR
ncbi:DegV family protein [Harryflintia acetispora]|uniref:DegV family protein with EDD domain n=1 Tax=Harryflintia acetispora TaxID=1849041 RepID=A0A9X8Y834_9FIRM|nr:DegV family protein [Harryflintia acetispora]TCL43276.1 DegV family protein with EDD domain [Harryflintia acetispora]